MDNVSSKYEAVRDLFKRAESAIHSLGIEGTGVDSVAINELRYAGQHILKAITSDSEKVQDKEIERAESHCERAIYDAYDGAVFYRLSLFRDFKKDYQAVSVSSVIPNYIEICARMEKSKKLLEQIRQESETRQQYYEKITEEYNEIKEYSEMLEAGREELNKEIAEKSTSNKRFFVQPAATLIGSLLAGLVSAILVLYVFPSG